MIGILGIADESSLKKQELSVLSVLSLRGRHRKVFSRCRKFHYQMRRKLVGTEFPGLKKVFKISDSESVVSTPRSLDTPRDSFSSEGTPRDLLSDSANMNKDKPMRQDSYTIQDHTLVIEDCGYAFSLPPGFNLCEENDKEEDEEECKPLKRQASIQLLKNGIDTLECCLDFLGPEELLQISTTCRSLFYLSESYWPSSRGLYSERVKKIRICSERLEKAEEDIKVVQKQVSVWETQQGAHVEKRLVTLRKTLGAREQEREFKQKELMRARSVLHRHKDLHCRFYLYGSRPDSGDSLSSRGSRRSNSILKSCSGRVNLSSTAPMLGNSTTSDSMMHGGSMTPTPSSISRDTLTSKIKSPVLTMVKSVPRQNSGMKPIKMEPRLTLSKSGPGVQRKHSANMS